MAKELAHFQNFAKLKDTQVAFNDITVIAGKPSTGKSYVMKMMYAIKVASYLVTEEPTAFPREIDEIEASLEKSSELDEIEIKKLIEKLSLIKKDVLHVQNNINQYIKNKFQQECQNVSQAIFKDIKQISNNFSINTNCLKLEYKNIFEIESCEKYDFSNYEPIFVETPLILEFKSFMKREKGKVPYHIESLLNVLDTDYSFTDEEQDKFIKEFTQKSKEIIKGDIESSGDSFIFNKEDEKNYDIINASSGTKSIGLLQYLVTNKALKKGSVLYWEEPEVHLHPEWQLRMIELFVELMNAGVKIVFSTHSPYMCDYLNAISQKQNFNDRVSFNLFEETDSVVNNHILESDEDWNKIQAELLDPLEEIMWEYI